MAGERGWPESAPQSLLALVALGALAGNQTLAAASASLDADEPVKAARDARWAKRLVPWSPEPWRLHGEALLSQGDLDGARRDFQSALRKDSSDWDSWVDLAWLREEERKGGLSSKPTA